MESIIQAFVEAINEEIQDRNDFIISSHISSVVSSIRLYGTKYSNSRILMMIEYNGAQISISSVGTTDINTDILDRQLIRKIKIATISAINNFNKSTNRPSTN